LQPSLVGRLSGLPGVHELRLQAEELESRYEWASAVKLYQQSLHIVPKLSPAWAALSERTGYAVYRLGMQANTRLEFRNALTEAISYHGKAIQILRDSPEPFDIARTHRCEAFVSYLRYWLAPTQSKKFEMLEKAWASTRECLKLMHETEAGQEYAGTYNQLSIIPWIHLFSPQAKKARLELIREAIDHGQNAIRTLQDTEYHIELARSYIHVSSLLSFLVEFEPASARDSVHLLRRYSKRAKELAEETAFVESSITGGGVDSEDTMEGGIKSCEQILPYVLKTRDNFMIGLTYDWLAMYTALRGPITDDLQTGATLNDRALSHAGKAKAHYDIISMVSPRAGALWVEFPEPEYFLSKSWFQPEPSRKRTFLIKAAKGLPHLLRLARTSMYPETIVDAHHVHSKTMLFLSKLEQDTNRKRKLLRQALWHRRESIRIQEEAWGESGIYHVLPLSYLGDVKFELAKTFANSRASKHLVNQAIQDKLSALEALSSDHNAILRETAEDYYFHWYAKIHSDIGTFSNFLFEISGDEDNLRKAAGEFVEAARSFQTLKQPSRVAENHRSAALCYSLMPDHAKAEEHFEEARKWYDTAATTIPVLADFYRDQLGYMAAWNRIEKARDHHDKQRYALAANLYNESAELFRSALRWSYLASQYQALSRMESAEDKSRRDLGDEAITEFEASSVAFSESAITIQIRLKDLESTEENQMALELLKKSGLRAEYCRARTEIEKAALLNKRGDHKESSEKYGRAIQILDSVAAQLPRGPQKNEALFVSKIARAWRAMARAEDDVSPSLYTEASELFKQSKDLSNSEDAKLLVLGHSNYCTALEKASRFFETGKLSVQAMANRYLETATGYYLKAGFGNASEYAIATKRFLEGQVLLNRANTERDSQKKAQIYSAAERILRSASNSFSELGAISKRDDVLRILERVRDEKDLALSVMSDLANPVILSTQTIPVVSPSRERSVGVGVFRSAYVQANLVASPSNPMIGEPLNLRIELANAGMSPAQLVSVQKVIPEGFELVEKPAEFSIQEGHHLLLKGRRLDPLKTDQVSLVFRPRIEGQVAVNPRVLYLDENGRDRFHEPKPLEITVNPNGKKLEVPLASDPGSSLVLDFLIRTFAEDYMQKRLSIDRAGWRGLLEIAKALKLPRNQLYGDARYGHTFGRSLEKLIKSGVAEFRVFPGERGRGGNVIRVRASYEREPVKRLVDSVALQPHR